MQQPADTLCNMLNDEEVERDKFWWDDAGLEMTFVENMRMLRERRNMSQTELAKRLSERGLAFHQPTVQRIEKGERPLRLTEALVIAEELNSDLQTMMNDVSLPFAYGSLVHAISWKQLQHKVDRLIHDRGVSYERTQIQEHLQDYLQAAKSFGAEPLSPAVERAEAVLERLDWIEKTLDKARSAIQEIVTELDEMPELPRAAHGGTPWDGDHGEHQEA